MAAKKAKAKRKTAAKAKRAAAPRPAKKRAPAKAPAKRKRPPTTKAPAKRKSPPKAEASAPPKAARTNTAKKGARRSPAAPDRQPQKPANAASRVGEGDSAPAFSLRDQDGETVSSTSLAGQPYVLYFYPKDDTPGCTREACDFRDSLGRLAGRARVLGVSPDSTESHKRFTGKYGLPFTLLSDPDKDAANAYGVWTKKKNYGREYMGIERSTFLVDADGVVRRAWRGVRVNGHVDAVLGELDRL